MFILSINTCCALLLRHAINMFSVDPGLINGAQMPVMRKKGSPPTQTKKEEKNAFLHRYEACSCWIHFKYAVIPFLGFMGHSFYDNYKDRIFVNILMTTGDDI